MSSFSFEFEFKNLTYMVAVDAAAAVKIDQLGFVGVTGIEEIEMQYLTLFYGIDYAKRGVDLFA